MPDSVTLQAAVASAEQAAMAGNFQAAAQHLRDALALQETDLGPTHPDVASTLNNLGVVCERLGNDEEAERCYRRACAIVTAAFPAEHPFVATSRQNLEAFCASHARPLDPAPELPSERPRAAAAPVASTPPAPPTLNEARRIESPRPPSARQVEPSPPPATGRSPVVWLIGALVVFVALAFWVSRGDRQSAAPIAATPSATPSPTPTVTPAATPTPAVASPVPTPSSTATTQPAPREPAPPRTAAPSQSDTLNVVAAELCRTLSTGAQWSCARPADPVTPGPLYFYTRIATPHDAVVVHTWYRNDRVELTRELQIHANQTPGYRTYSRLTIDAGASGNWRIEVRTTDGKVLREARFVVK